jgi:hypothetical protein
VQKVKKPKWLTGNDDDHCLSTRENVSPAISNATLISKPKEIDGPCKGFPGLPGPPRPSVSGLPKNHVLKTQV